MALFPVASERELANMIGNELIKHKRKLELADNELFDQMRLVNVEIGRREAAIKLTQELMHEGELE